MLCVTHLTSYNSSVLDSGSLHCQESLLLDNSANSEVENFNQSRTSRGTRSERISTNFNTIN